MKRNILTITVVDNVFYFDVLCVEKTKEIKIDFRLGYLLDRNNNSLAKHLETLAKNIRQDLIHKEYFKYPVLVNLNLDGIFIENLELPRLSKKELLRAVHLELAKLYGDFENKFVYSALLYPEKKQNYNIRVALYNLEIYRHLLQFIRKTRLKIERIALAPNNFKNMILNKKIINQPEKANLVTNVGKNFSTIVAIKDKTVIAHYIVHYGYKNFNDKFMELLKNWDSGETLPTALKRELNRETSRIMKEVFRISGGLIKDYQVETYLYVEDEIETKLIKAIEMYYDLEINQLITQPYLKELFEVSAIAKIDRRHDFIFPTRLSDEKH